MKRAVLLFLHLLHGDEQKKLSPFDVAVFLILILMVAIEERWILKFKPGGLAVPASNR